MHGTKDTGGKVELLLERAENADTALVQARASKGLRPGATVTLPGGHTARMLEREETEIAAVLARSAKPVVVYSYTSPGDANVELLGRLGLPWYPNARRAARALAVLEAAGQQRPQSLGA